MDERTVLARDLMREKQCTCVFLRDGETVTEYSRGIAPLLSYLDSGRTLTGFCAADKVVGRAAAFLYVLLQVDELYAEVISESAEVVLRDYGVRFFAGETVPAIRNRTGDGFCPMEQATISAHDPQTALTAIRNTLEYLKKK